MSEKNVDRRVKYTKMVIKKSFISILKQKPISKITIKEICEDADINRATFYAHYNDQYDLLQQIETEFLEDVNRHIEVVAYDCTENESIEALTKILEYIRENADLCSVILSDKGDLSFQKEVMMRTQAQFVSECVKRKALAKEDAEYLYVFIGVGSAGIIQKWIADGMKKSAREIAEIIMLITHKGFMV